MRAKRHPNGNTGGIRTGRETPPKKLRDANKKKIAGYRQKKYGAAAEKKYEQPTKRNEQPHKKKGAHFCAPFFAANPP